MTSFDDIYDIFLGKIKEDDWDDPTLLETYRECWDDYLKSAIGFFKFPRVDLTMDTDSRTIAGDLGNNEKQILADYMKVEWLQANVLTWEKIKTDYAEADFSQANLLDKLDKTLKTTIARAERREKNYYRSIGGNPYPYAQLAGDGREQ